MKAKSDQSERQEISGCSTSPPLLARRKKKPSSATAECRLQSKKTTLLDRLFSCASSFRMPRLSKMSDLGSTSKEKDLGPYWNERCAEISSQLWLPTKTDLQDLALRSSNSSSKKPVEKSWFSTEFYTVQKKSSQKTYSRYCTSFLVGSMDSGATVRKSRKIRIYPTAEQRQLFRRWFGAQRFIYNRTIELLRDVTKKANWKSQKGGVLADLPVWAESIPYQIKSVAVRDACRAVSAAKRKYRATKQIQKVGFRTRKNPKQSCYLPKSAVSETGIYPTLAGKLRWSEKLPAGFGDCRLIFENGRWFVSTSFLSRVKRAENQGRPVSLDPGVRTFLTLFSPKDCGKLGKDNFGWVVRQCVYLDRLKSKCAKATGRQKRRFHRAIWRQQWNIRDHIDELHHQAARFLVDNYDVIFLPEFESSQMVVRTGRKIRSKTVLAMLTWAHFRFRQFLQHKAKECGKIVVLTNEAYTSKTVSWTGEIVQNLGGRKTIRSELTGVEMDRDYNGARGIFLRALRDTSPGR